MNKAQVKEVMGMSKKQTEKLMELISDEGSQRVEQLNKILARISNDEDTEKATKFVECTKAICLAEISTSLKVLLVLETLKLTTN